jgi:HD-GYP domain-containing protein (c-di-GMP phosphodiesterase class II)
MSSQTTKDNVERQAKVNYRTSLDKMDAIAYGVEARCELFTGHSKRIVEETVAIARKLGLSENEIKKWSASRLNHDMAKVKKPEFLFQSMQ